MSSDKPESLVHGGQGDARVQLLLGEGEALLEGIDLPVLGYRVRKHVATEAAMHLVVGR